MAHAYTVQEDAAVAVIDAVTADQDGLNKYMIHLFKDYVSAQFIDLEWYGKSSLAPVISPVILQIYNRISAEWETLAFNNAANANTFFMLSATVMDLTNYKDGSNIVSCRVYQLST